MGTSKLKSAPATLYLAVLNALRAIVVISLFVAPASAGTQPLPAGAKSDHARNATDSCSSQAMSLRAYRSAVAGTWAPLLQGLDCPLPARIGALLFPRNPVWRKVVHAQVSGTIPAGRVAETPEARAPPHA